VPFLRSPAQAGAHYSAAREADKWILAFAGKRRKDRRQNRRNRGGIYRLL